MFFAVRNGVEHLTAGHEIRKPRRLVTGPSNAAA